MQHLRRTFVVTIALITVLAAGQCLAQQNQVVATVNGQPIDSDTLTDELLRRWGDIALGSLIQELAVQQAAAEAGVSVDAEEVEERADTFRRNIDINAASSGGNFSMWLAQNKMTPYAFRRWIRTEYLLEKLVGDEAAVTEDEVRAYYDDQQQRFRQPERMRVSHICVNEKAEADRIRAEIINGKSFEDAAREYSIDPYTRDEGGKFGIIPRGESSFQKAAFTLQDNGAMTEPVRTEKGWHIIRRDEHMPAGTPSFEEMKDQLTEQLRQQKLMAMINKKRSEIMQSARVEQEIEPDDLAGQR
ncbi:MAG: peptidyl-prolyl cis-trans isomerase [Armatimonadota bacterium]|jgi:foldase protein PrsA